LLRACPSQATVAGTTDVRDNLPGDPRGRARGAFQGEAPSPHAHTSLFETHGPHTYRSIAPAKSRSKDLIHPSRLSVQANTRARLVKSVRKSVVVKAEYDADERRGRDTTFGGRQQMLEKGDDADTSSFWGKVKAAFAIFFPPSEEETARLEAKKRLRMILVADRCAMSGAAMSEMKTRIVEVVSDFVEVDEELGIEVSMSQDPEVAGTIYAVSIPVRGVKPQFDVENETYGWDEEPMYDDDVWEKSEAEK